MSTTMSCALAKVRKTEYITEKTLRFLTSKRGQSFMKDLHRYRVDILCKRHNIPSILLGKNFKKTYNIINYVIKQNNIRVTAELAKPTIMYNIKQKKKITNVKIDHAKYIIKPLTRTQLMRGYELHKLEKWEKRNPNPIDKYSPSLFDQEFQNEWEIMRENAIEHIRDMIVSRYDKLPVYAKFEGSSGYDKKIAMIRDIDGTGHRINDVNIEDSKTLQLAQKVANQVYATNPKLVAIQVMDHLRKRGRLILPKVA